jgi:hypothetical protein
MLAILTALGFTPTYIGKRATWVTLITGIGAADEQILKTI